MSASPPPPVQARSRACVVAVVGVLVLGACSSDDDDDDSSGVVEPPTMSGAPSGNFAIVMNDGAAPGSVVFYAPDLETLDKTLSTGYNEGIAFGEDGTLYQNGDAEAATGLVAFADGAGRPDMDGFGMDDRELGTAPGKGLEFVASQGLLASCDVTDENAELKLFDASTGALENTVDLPAACWDTFYVEATDRLYVAQVNGVLSILDAFVAGLADAGGPTVDRSITPVGAAGTDNAGSVMSVNLHGVHAEGDVILLTDVGDAASPSDGQLFVFEDDGALDGDVPMSAVGGSATLLGNPVDAVLRDGAAIVAEKSNDAILVFDNVVTLSGNVMPSYSLSFVKPESIAEVPSN